MSARVRLALFALVACLLPVAAAQAIPMGAGRVRFVSFFNGPAGGPYDLGGKPRSLAAYRRSITPLSS